MATTGDAVPASVVIRPLRRGDAAAMVSFMEGIGEGERRFVKEGFADTTEVLEAFESVAVVRRLVAVEPDGAVVGMAGVFAQAGWSSHVAELRVLVAPTHRRHGVGRALAREALLEALRLGCALAYVEVVAEQEALVTMFQDMGFEAAALLPDFVRDATGEFHDLLMLTHRADEQPGLAHLLALDEVAG